MIPVMVVVVVVTFDGTLSGGRGRRYGRHPRWDRIGRNIAYPIEWGVGGTPTQSKPWECDERRVASIPIGQS